jgi:hypothetical protein
LNRIRIFILTSLLTISLGSIAHQDHGNELFQETNITQKEAAIIAIDEITKQIKGQKIPNTWNKASASSAVLTRLDSRQVWKIIFTLPANNNSDLKQLELFVSKTGDLIPY